VTAYVEQLRWSKKRVNPIDRGLQIVRLLLANNEAHRRGLTIIVHLASGIVFFIIFHVSGYYQNGETNNSLL
jgi:hypothetical protein